jgi:hypothetical protein
LFVGTGSVGFCYYYYSAASGKIRLARAMGGSKHLDDDGWDPVFEEEEQRLLPDLCEEEEEEEEEDESCCCCCSTGR